MGIEARCVTLFRQEARQPMRATESFRIRPQSRMSVSVNGDGNGNGYDKLVSLFWAACLNGGFQYSQACKAVIMHTYKLVDSQPRGPKARQPCPTYTVYAAMTSHV